MKTSRRAAAIPASPAARHDTTLAVLRALTVGLAAALAVSLGALAAVAVAMARRVVTPARRLADTQIVSVDLAAQTITLTKTPDTVLPGRYGLFTEGSEPYLKLGSVLTSDETTVTRKLLTEVDTQTRLSAAAAFSGWYYSTPDELHLPYSTELIHSAVGACPAWLFPAGDGATWAILVHGRGTTRAECLRAVPTFVAAGISTLVVSYRNDGEAPRSRSGTYTLGATEWRDVDAAIGWARRRGAMRILLMGWSMGGAIVLQTAVASAHREHISAVALDSPVIDWRSVLDFQGRLLRLPAAVTGLTIEILRADWTRSATGAGNAIPFERLDMVARAAELRHPILILHSDDDGFVPSDASHALARSRPDLVELHVFTTARHTKLWNYDQDRFTDALEAWIGRHQLASTGETAS